MKRSSARVAHKNKEFLNESIDHAGYRHLRLQSVICDELNELFRNEISDPMLVDILVNHVELSVDYRHAKVYLTAFGSSDRKANVEQALARAKQFLRAQLNDVMELKRVPDLRFIVSCAALLQEL